MSTRDEMQSVVLGTDELTSGIPGSGPLTLDEISQWLSREENHQTLKLKLPVGLNLLPNRLNKLPTPLTRAKIELGRQLFFDSRLSVDNTVSCASCHEPSHGYTIPKRFAKGVRGQIGDRNPPTLINRVMFAGIGEEEFWDGHAASLEDAVLVAITDPTEMDNSLEDVIKTLRRNHGYDMQFQRIYKGVTVASIGDAVAAFVRVIVSGATPFDHDQAFEPLKNYDRITLAEDAELAEKYKRLKAVAEANPLSDAARRGMNLYFDMKKAWCVGCHPTPALTDSAYHNIGVGMQDDTPDLGRFLVTGEDKTRGAFKTPSLRNVTMTAPYMHDGRFQTLEEVLKWYGTDKFENPHLDSRFERIRLTGAEQKDLVEFLKACTGKLPRVERGRLPPD
ncbi:MAG: cytochrome c peroxidase [Fuerstiella sp.]